jgi:hypothetical protein
VEINESEVLVVERVIQCSRAAFKAVWDALDAYTCMCERYREARSIGMIVYGRVSRLLKEQGGGVGIKVDLVSGQAKYPESQYTAILSISSAITLQAISHY